MIFSCFLKVGSSNSNSIAFVVVNLSFFFSFPVLYPCPFCKIVYLFFYLGIQNVKSSSLKGGSNTWKWVCIIFSFFSFVLVSSAILCRKIDNRCILSCSVVAEQIAISTNFSLYKETIYTTINT